MTKVPKDLQTGIILPHLTPSQLAKVREVSKAFKGYAEEALKYTKQPQYTFDCSQEKQFEQLKKALEIGKIKNIKLVSCSNTKLKEVLPLMNEIIILNLSSNGLGEDGVMTLITPESLSKLESLNLDLNRITSKSLKMLVDSPLASHLISLSLRYNKLVGRQIGQVIADSKMLTNLVELDLSFNPIRDGVIAIAASENLPKLKYLSLFRTFIADDVAKVISKSKTLSNLVGLDLGANDITNNGIIALAESQFLSNLESLSLMSNHLNNGGARTIANSQFLTQLTFLNLSDNNIQDEGGQAIAESETLKNLTVLYLGDNDISDEVKNKILARFEFANFDSSSHG